MPQGFLLCPNRWNNWLPTGALQTTVASNKWAAWRLWESTWRISGMKSLSISGCTIGFRHHLRHLPVHFVIAPLVLTSLAINLVYQLVWWAAYFFQVTWEISQVAVMIIFVWRQIHSWGQIHNKLIGCKGGEAPWIMRSWRFATGLGRDFVDAEVWGHFAGSTTTHVRDLRFEWNCQKYFEHKRSAIRNTSMFSCRRHWQNAEKLRINDNYHVLLVQALSPGHLKLGSLGSDISSNLHLASWVLNPFHPVAMTTVVLFWICIVPCLWLNTASHREFAPDLSFPQQSHQSLHLSWTHRKKRPYMLSHPMVSAIFLERPEGLKIKKQIVFGNVCCLFSSFQKSEITFHKQPPQTSGNVLKSIGTRKWWFPKGISTSVHFQVPSSFWVGSLDSSNKNQPGAFIRSHLEGKNRDFGGCVLVSGWIRAWPLARGGNDDAVELFRKMSKVVRLEGWNPILYRTNKSQLWNNVCTVNKYVYILYIHIHIIYVCIPHNLDKMTVSLQAPKTIFTDFTLKNTLLQNRSAPPHEICIPTKTRRW